MAKALKAFIVLLLLLSIASLVLGILLFKNREILKGRTQKLEASVASVTTALNGGREPFIKDLGIALSGETLKSYEGMDGELLKLQKLAENRYTELDNTYADLKRTADELAVTKDELTTTKGELARSQEQVQQLTVTVAEKTAEIARKEDQIVTLEQEKASQQVQIDELNNTVAKMEDEKQDLKDKVVTLEQTIVELEALTGDSAGRPLPRGLSGTVLLVNKAWNFVVLDLGSDDGLVPNAEMLVHRGDKLIGKVQISGVTRQMAIADINAEWTESLVREGDFVAVQ
jgi:uncharacterized coiled-coil protein SlyX